jgi:hypothetical protein
MASLSTAQSRWRRLMRSNSFFYIPFSILFLHTILIHSIDLLKHSASRMIFCLYVCRFVSRDLILVCCHQISSCWNKSILPSVLQSFRPISCIKPFGSAALTNFHLLLVLISKPRYSVILYWWYPFLLSLFFAYALLRAYVSFSCRLLAGPPFSNNMKRTEIMFSNIWFVINLLIHGVHLEGEYE